MNEGQKCNCSRQSITDDLIPPNVRVPTLSTPTSITRSISNNH